MRSTNLKQRLCILAAGSALLLAACGGGGDKSPTGPDDGGNDGGDGVAAEFTLASIGFVGLPAYLTIEDCTPTRFTGGGMWFYDDGSWEFAIAIQRGRGGGRRPLVRGG